MWVRHRCSLPAQYPEAWTHCLIEHWKQNTCGVENANKILLQHNAPGSRPDEAIVQAGSKEEAAVEAPDDVRPARQTWGCKRLITQSCCVMAMWLASQLTAAHPAVRPAASWDTV